jgi:hypothetical protein
MIKKIMITPEWVLEKLPYCHYADGKGNISVYYETDNDANWIELALDSLNIKYKAIIQDDDGEILYGIVFRIEDIQEECPSFYSDMKKMDTNNFISKNLSKN